MFVPCDNYTKKIGNLSVILTQPTTIILHHLILIPSIHGINTIQTDCIWKRGSIFSEDIY